jgi:glycosyltransferase involved in cell wall biosynthesis
MKIGIFNSCRQTPEAAQLSCTTLARALVKKFQVELIVNFSFATNDHLANFSAGSGVSLRTVDDPACHVLDPLEPVQRYELQRRWSDEVTSRYDLFINFADRLPIFCSAPNGVLVVESPYDFIPSIYRSLWVEHLASYQLKLATSYYTRFWTKVLWDIETAIIYPSVPFEQRSSGGKDNLIVVSGPIQPLQHQLDLINAFLHLKENLPEWSLTVMGKLDQIRANKKYCDMLCAAGTDPAISIVTNPSAERQSEIFRRSKILWRASGLGTDVEVDPKRVEPFGVDVLQAMVNGCVPLAVNSGSLSEVIRHRESGVFWDSPEELLEQTLALAEDQSLLRSLSEGAQRRARAFNSKRFTDKFLRELQDAFGIRAVPLFSPARLWKRVIRSADQFFVARR